MMYLDRKKAKELVLAEIKKEKNNLIKACLQLSGDEFWNTEIIFEDKKFVNKRLFKCYEMSYWAIPVVRFFYKDGKERTVACFSEDEKFGRKIEKKMELQAAKALKDLVEITKDLEKLNKGLTKKGRKYGKRK